MALIPHPQSVNRALAVSHHLQVWYFLMLTMENTGCAGGRNFIAAMAWPCIAFHRAAPAQAVAQRQFRSSFVLISAGK